MSAIVGLLNFDGANATKPMVTRMLNPLRIYGPDRASIMCAGAVGLGQALMRMTPEDRFDYQPFRSSDGTTIVADIRLDNRDEMLALVGANPASAADLPDCQVVLSAWRKLGEKTWSSLRGPFAIAIWDAPNRKLILARDHLGLRNIVWHQAGRFFAFASMPKGLFAHPQIPSTLNEQKFADFLVLNHSDHETTIYGSIQRVPPAHAMTVASNGTQKCFRYWSADEVKPVRFVSDASYEEALRERLKAAVRRQMRSCYEVGCLLTGGLDSSSVAFFAGQALGERNKRLATYTQLPRRGFKGPVPPGRYADESGLVESICGAVSNIDANYIYNDECDDFAELDAFFHALDGPVRNPTNLGWTLSILRLAREQGRRVLLGGLHGNNTISWNGWSQVINQLAVGNFFQTIKQSNQYYRLSALSRWQAFRKLLVDPAWIMFFGANNAWHGHNEPPWYPYSAIHGSFAYRMNVLERATQFGHDFKYRLQRHERHMGLSGVDYLGEWAAAEKAVTGVEVRDPTADIDLVEYCFGVPPEQFLVEGTDRSLIRRAMWGYLPRKVLTNRLSGLQAADWYEKIGSKLGLLKKEVLMFRSFKSADRMIDLTRLEQLIDSWPDAGFAEEEIVAQYHFALTRGIAAARFLQWMESPNLELG